jgi:type IV secretion system protein TrbL
MMPDLNSLTRTLQNFIAVFGSGYTNLSSTINALLAMLAIIELALLGFWWALGGGEQLVPIFKKLLYIGFWIYIVQSFPSLAKAFVTSLVKAGLTAGGGSVTVSQILDPSALMGAGVDATQALAQKLGEMGTFDLADMIVFGLGYLTIMACFLIMAINLFLAVIEYYLFAGIVGILLPFGLLPATKFLAEKAIGAVVAAGIKLMVLSFITSAVLPLIVSTRFPGTDELWSLNELWATILTMAGITALSWKAPGLAASLMSGSPSLGVEHVAQAGLTGFSLGMQAGQATAGLATGNPLPALTAATGAASSAGSAASSGVSAGVSPSASAAPSVPTATPTLVRSLAT